MKIAASSSWDLSRITEYLNQTAIPMRIAAHKDEFPFICSLWFTFDEARGELVCASHESSYLVKLLKANNRCAFEIAPNEPPYHGVRGQAYAELVREGADEVLPALLAKYLDDSNDSLAAWLLSRTAEEYVIRLKPTWVSSWDYSNRMTSTGG